jgi:hypothetical protein
MTAPKRQMFREANKRCEKCLTYSSIPVLGQGVREWEKGEGGKPAAGFEGTSLRPS